MASVDAPTTIIGSEEEVAKFLEPREPRACTVLNVTASIGVALEGKFILPGETQEYKEYASAQEMIQDQPPLPDPVFEKDDVLPTMEDAGFPLNKIEEYDAEFKKMYEDMFSRSSELGVMGAGDFEARLLALQNELSDSKVENSNGGGIDLIPSGRSSVYPSQRSSTPFCDPVQIPCAGDFTPPPPTGGHASDSNVNDGQGWSSVDA
jgi:hypothetical protein